MEEDVDLGLCDDILHGAWRGGVMEGVMGRSGSERVRICLLMNEYFSVLMERSNILFVSLPRPLGSLQLSTVLKF